MNLKKEIYERVSGNDHRGGMIGIHSSLMKRVIVVLFVSLPMIDIHAQPTATRSITASDWQNIGEHPRLLADEKKISFIKNSNDPVLLQLKALLKLEAEKKLTAEPILYPSQGFKFYAIREVQARILTLALAYKVFGERKYFEKAKGELMQLSALPDWCPGHFLDVGEAALAAGIGLDWLFTELTSEERIKISTAITNKALLPSMNVQPAKGGWMAGDFNWTQVCHAGLSVGALAIAEFDPQLAKTIVDRAVKYVPNAGAVYAPDGTYPEGPSYWAYGTTFHVILIEALRSAFHTSAGLETFPGFMNTVDYRLQMVGPSGKDFNYADYHDEHQHDPVMFWFARELQRKELTSAELLKIRELTTQSVQSSHELSTNGLKSNRQLAFSLLWWDDQLPDRNGNQTLHWTAGGILPLATLRSAWDDSLATYVAMKGGTPKYSHAHMDIGSFIFEDAGVRWAIDLGTESYDKMRDAKLDLWNYEQSSSRWSTFRVGSESHNILRFNDSDQQVEGNATLVALRDDEKGIGNKIDLTSLYDRFASHVTRTILLARDRSVLIHDGWTAKAEPLNVAWQWTTSARVEKKSTSEIVLSQDGKRLVLSITSDTIFHYEVEDISLPRHVQDSPNIHCSRIVIHVTTAPGMTSHLAVKVSLSKEMTSINK